MEKRAPARISKGKNPTKGNTTIGVRCSAELLADVDAWRRSQVGQVVEPTRAAALRHLAELGLQSVKKTRPGPKGR